MSIRPATMYVTHELRAKIKALKRELTYDEFLQNLIKKVDSSSPKPKPNAIHSPNSSKKGSVA